MRLKLSTVGLICIAALLVQGCSLKYRLKKTDKKFAQGEYYSAGNRYKNLYGRIPYSDKALRARVSFNQAECFRLINNNSRAEMAYQNAIRNKTTDTLVYLRYAQVLQRSGKYTDAARNYAIFLQKYPTHQQARNEMKACQLVADWKKTPTRYTVQKNTVFNERGSSSFSPAFIGDDEDALIFSSSRQFNKKTPMKVNTITGVPSNNLFMSRKDAVGKWEKPSVIGSEINTVESDEGVCAFSPDGKIMYFTKARQVADAQVGAEIFYSNRAGTTWSEPKKIKIFADTTISVAHPAISTDGQTLYFVSDAKNGQGGKDIWKAKIDGAACKYIENLGPQINTPGDEMFPSIKADGTLYFASDGWSGYGGLDIFKATQANDTTWLVQNMGEPINSSADDFGITFAGKAERGFFSSTRGDLKGYDAIWNFELPELAYTVEGKVTDEKGSPISEATVKMISNTGVNARVQTKKDGSYKLKLDKDIECVMLATSRGYLNQQNKVSTMGLTNSKTFTVDFKLSSISKPVKIDNIFYEFGKWDLTPASTAGLQVLVKLLKDNPNITIELSANTDFVGNNEDNKTLSEKRAKSVVDYLIKAGIAADRLTPVGNGEDKPVVVDAALAKKYSFMKENDVLNEAFIIKLSPDQQEVVNQINRRTEFRVLKTTYKLY